MSANGTMRNTVKKKIAGIAAESEKVLSGVTFESGDAMRFVIRRMKRHENPIYTAKVKLCGFSARE
jgi:hypothetical protein